MISLGLTSTVSADKSFRIHSPRGSVINLVITSCALRNIRVHDLNFSNGGDVFSIAAAPLGSADSIQTISIAFHQDSTEVQSEYVDIGPEKTVQEVYCPEDFDQIIIDCSG
jgi:hypothetical protein